MTDVTARGLCQRYENGRSEFDNGLDAGRYLAAVSCDRLPRQVSTDDRRVLHGYAVGFGQWFFFPALEPAITFGRAARMSIDCTGYGVYEAAWEVRFCPDHGTDERVLHLTGVSLDRQPGEVEILERFVQGVKDNPESALWRVAVSSGFYPPL
ncbi:hypothetical protein [Micromonospora sp. RV43]|uniref:hypothetical protein n=1 Tax=Micromonospora sp. RV43 TaxID=1661387 RepID=UPI00064BE239|nr:hypothetical protein [Micromonospora sp. RV43]